MEAAKKTMESLEPAIAWRALNLIREIDRIRDQNLEPVAMLTAVITLLARELQTELCLLMLRYREATAVELKAPHNGIATSRDACVVLFNVGGNGRGRHPQYPQPLSSGQAGICHPLNRCDHIGDLSPAPPTPC